MDPHEMRELRYTSQLSEVMRVRKEILNVLQPHLATFMLRRTPFILFNGLSRPEH